MDPKILLEVAKHAFRKWQAHNAGLRAAALAFFAFMPLPSLLLILAEISVLIYGQPQAIQELIAQISVVAGPAVAGMVGQLLLMNAGNPFASSFGAIISIIFALVGAIGAFLVLQDTLNLIWDVVPPKKRSFKERIYQRIVPFLLISGTAGIVAAWTSLSTLLYGGLSIYLQPLIGSSAAVLIGTAQVLLSFGLSVLLFAIIFTQVPDVNVAWSDVWLASLITGAICTAVDYLFGIYIRTFPVTTILGAAGDLMALLLWIFVIAEFILFGAQFSNAYAETLGSHAVMKRMQRLQPKKSDQKKGLKASQKKN
jgi:membrane protein